MRQVDPKRYLVQFIKGNDPTWQYDEAFTKYEAAEQRADMMLAQEGAKTGTGAGHHVRQGRVDER